MFVFYKVSCSPKNLNSSSGSSPTTLPKSHFTKASKAPTISEKGDREINLIEERSRRQSSVRSEWALCLTRAYGDGVPFLGASALTKPRAGPWEPLLTMVGWPSTASPRVPTGSVSPAPSGQQPLLFKDGEPRTQYLGSDFIF